MTIEGSRQRFEDRETFEAACRECRAGTMSAGEFLRVTDGRWRAMAVRLHQRWRRKLPDWVEPDDVLQEIRQIALEHLGKWQPARGAVGPFVVWCTQRRAQRQMHRWRGAKLSGNEGRNPSRFEVPASRLAGRWQEDGDAERVFEQLAACGPVAEELLLVDDRARAVLRRARDWREVVVLQALMACEGSIEDAVGLIQGNLGARLHCGARDPEAIRDAVTRVLGRFARDAGVEHLLAEVAGTRVPAPSPALFDAIEDDEEPLPGEEAAA